MKLNALFAILAVSFFLPQASAAQGFGVAARAGTLGLGAEAGLGLGDRLVLRGGLGLMPLEINATVSDIDLTFELPRTWYNVGVDLYVNDIVRVGGGFLFKPDNVTLMAVPTTSQDIGGQEFTPEQIGTLLGTLDSGGRAPYVLIGFGKHTASGIGLTLDIGAAFFEETGVVLDSEEGTLSNNPDFRDRLEAEARNFEADLPRYIDIWPILSLGLRIGVGR
jgi:hypothetical protein